MGLPSRTLNINHKKGTIMEPMGMVSSSLSTDVQLRQCIKYPHVEPRRSVLCEKNPFANLMSGHGGAFCVGNSYLQTSGRAMEEHFAWEIPIYKLNLLNWSVSCGKFLFTNSTSVFSLFTNYLQTYLQTSLLREKALSRRAIRGQKSFNQTLDFYMPVPENSFFP